LYAYSPAAQATGASAGLLQP
jgi:hypothetical protein